MVGSVVIVESNVKCKWWTNTICEKYILVRRIDFTHKIIRIVKEHILYAIIVIKVHNTEVYYEDIDHMLR